MLTSRAYRADPWAAYATLAQGPAVTRQRMALVGKVWLVAHYDACFEALKEQERFCRDPANAGRGTMVGWLKWMPRRIRALSRNIMLQRDGADHRRLRGLVDKAFGKRGVEAMRARIETAAEMLLERIGGHAEVDLMTALARPLPLRVIHELMGTPEADRARFDRWAGRLVPGGSTLSIIAALPAILRVLRYLEREFERRRVEPREGLISELVAAEEAGDRLDADELLATALLLLFAGHATTTNLIGSGMRLILENPGAGERLAAEPEFAVPVVEELLRLRPPAQLTACIAAEAGDWHGAAMERGDVVILGLAAANLDPRKFEDPLAFEPSRSPNRHLAFSTGAHACLGQQLARMEARAVFSRIFQRFPGMRLADPDAAPRWAGKTGAKGLKSLVVRPHG